MVLTLEVNLAPSVKMPPFCPTNAQTEVNLDLFQVFVITYMYVQNNWTLLILLVKTSNCDM
jgi:hypothetical protein